jgi:hypothetical protein
LPGLWVSSALSNGWDPEGSLACKIYQHVQDTLKSGAGWMVAEQKILQLIGEKFFAQPEAFVEAYVM